MERDSVAPLSHLAGPGSVPVASKGPFHLQCPPARRTWSVKFATSSRVELESMRFVIQLEKSKPADHASSNRCRLGAEAAW